MVSVSPKIALSKIGGKFDPKIVGLIELANKYECKLKTLSRNRAEVSTGLENAACRSSVCITTIPYINLQNLAKDALVDGTFRSRQTN